MLQKWTSGKDQFYVLVWKWPLIKCHVRTLLSRRPEWGWKSLSELELYWWHDAMTSGEWATRPYSVTSLIDQKLCHTTTSPVEVFGGRQLLRKWTCAHCGDMGHQRWCLCFESTRKSKPVQTMPTMLRLVRQSLWRSCNCSLLLYGWVSKALCVCMSVHLWLCLCVQARMWCVYEDVRLNIYTQLSRGMLTCWCCATEVEAAVRNGHTSVTLNAHQRNQVFF